MNTITGNQEVIYLGARGYSSIEKHYGTNTLQAARTINDIVRAYLEETYPQVRGAYLAAVVREEETGYIGRKLTNMFRGCPEFYPLDENRISEVQGIVIPVSALEHLHRVATGIPYQVPVTNDFDPLEVTRQTVLTAARVPDHVQITHFGPAAIEYAETMTEYLEREHYLHKRRFAPFIPYIVRQFIGERCVYAGQLLTNLVPGVPTFYPQYPRVPLANRWGGYRELELPENILQQVREVDLSGCALSPIPGLEQEHEVKLIR